METATTPRRCNSLLWQGAVLSLILASPLGTLHGQPSPDLKFTISLPKQEFKIGQPVRLQMKLENTSDHPVVINSRFLVNDAIGPHEVVLQVFGPDLKTLPFLPAVRAAFESDVYETLAPHQAATTSDDLAQDFDLSRPGECSVRAYYQNQYDAPAKRKLPPAWKGTLESNRVQFKLK